MYANWIPHSGVHTVMTKTKHTLEMDGSQVRNSNLCILKKVCPLGHQYPITLIS